ncbi:MAG: hypothetical protein ABIN94_06765 [Ferruginibacter sp.]
MLYAKSTSTGTSSHGIVSAIIKTGLLAGTLDICCAMLQFYLKNGKNPIIVLKFVASAIFDKAAFAEGYYLAAMGLLFHYIIAFGWTILFFLIYHRMHLLAKNKIVVGLLYGIFVWLMMNLIVVPATNIQRAPFKLVPSLTGALILVVAIGLPISIMANRYYSKRNIASQDASLNA